MKWGDTNRKWVDTIDTGLSNDIFALLVDEKTESVFVGGGDQVLKQFNLKNGSLMKEYNNLGVSYIHSLSSFKHLLCVGGIDNFSLIDMEQSKVLSSKPVKTSIRSIFTSQFWVAKEEQARVRVRLALSGGNS